MTTTALAYQQAIMPVDPGAIAAAEAVKARIQSAYIMAMQRPRNFMESRSRIIDACKRPEFASKVEYSKPVGNTKIVGPSIRFAELAVREWGNVITETQLVYEDEKVRRIKVTVTDLETNASFSKEIHVTKTVERASAAGRELIGKRKNSYNKDVYIVVATDEELHNKEAALISKVIRNEGLRLIPQDIIDDAVETARATIRDRDAKDPKAEMKRLADAFSRINISPKNLEKYLGHPLDIVSVSELQDLRGVYTAVSSGDASWAEYISKPEEKTPVTDLNEVLKPKADEPGQETNSPADPPKPEHKPTAKELEEMRADMVAEIADRGIALSEIEKIVGAYANKWTAKQVAEIRAKHLPNLLAELAGA